MGLKLTLDVEVYNDPKKGDWHQAKYLVRGIDDVYWTNDITSVLRYLEEDLERIEEEQSGQDPFKEFRLKPNGKVFLRATGANRYSGGDSKWHLVTGYIHGTEESPFGEDFIYATFTWNGEKNGVGVDLSLKERECKNLEFRLGSSRGQPITEQQAVDIIVGREPKKKENKTKGKSKNGRHNNKKADR